MAKYMSSTIWTNNSMPGLSATIESYYYSTIGFRCKIISHETFAFIAKVGSNNNFDTQVRRLLPQDGGGLVPPLITINLIKM
jgi:hypothetical protein